MPQQELTGKLTGTTRRSFIRGVAAAGASTVGATALAADGSDLFGTEAAQAAGPATPFSSFTALAASPADAFQVPEGFTAQVVISYGDTITDAAGETMPFGYNNDFLAFFPLKGGSSSEGILFVNHEYPGPFFQHGYKPAGAGPGRRTKTPEQIQLEKDTVGNAFVHIRRGADGRWQVQAGSPYNRRIYGDRPALQITGPLRGPEDFSATPQKVGETAAGSLANCSGGITPWRTVLSCEENYDGYGRPLGSSSSAYGWEPENYDQNQNKTYGYVVEHDPYAPSSVGRKHTALGRFRHENTAFRAATDARFVLYMGDDANNEGVYKFVSDRRYIPGDRANNLKILEAGTLYIAEWFDDDGDTVINGAGRRRFAQPDGVNLVSPTSGRGAWVEVDDADLVDTRARLRARYGVDAYVDRFATNRPEDVEVDEDGRIYVALTNNQGGSDSSSRGSRAAANDPHGSVRRLREQGDDPEAVAFTWEEFAAGGPSGREEAGQQGFSSPDNLVFDQGDNVWVVTDISSSSLNKPNAYEYHGNNGVFMVPRSGPNAGVAFRFANMPAEAEATGPYFTPDESTLFIAVQHPGEESGEGGSPAVYEDPSTFTSYWPRGNKTTGQNPATPLPSVVAIYRTPPVPPRGEDLEPGTPSVIPPPPPGRNPDGTPAPDGGGTAAGLVVRPIGRSSIEEILGKGLDVRLRSDEDVTVEIRLRGRVRSRRRGRKRPVVSRTTTLARRRVKLEAGSERKIRLKATAAGKVLLRRRGASVLKEVVRIAVIDGDGNERRVSKTVRVR